MMNESPNQGFINNSFQENMEQNDAHKMHNELISYAYHWNLHIWTLELIAFHEVERKPNFVAWLCIVSCPV